MLFNFFTLEGKRSSIQLTTSDVRAIHYLMKSDTNKSVIDYVTSKQWMAKARPRPQSFTAFLRECIMLDLLFCAQVFERNKK